MINRCMNKCSSSNTASQISGGQTVCQCATEHYGKQLFDVFLGHHCWVLDLTLFRTKYQRCTMMVELKIKAKEPFNSITADDMFKFSRGLIERITYTRNRHGRCC